MLTTVCVDDFIIRSTSPSPFTGYSFHVLEALLVFANEVLVCFMIPLHLGVHRIYHLLTTLIHEGNDQCIVMIMLHVLLGECGCSELQRL